MSGFTFFKPEFLWGLSFLGIIFIIHLLRRPKIVHLDFSTLKFFTNSAVKTARIRKLRNLLLLIFRLLIALLIILLFARPYNRNNILSELNNPQTPIYVWIDPTSSMEYNEKGTSIGRHAYDLIDSAALAVPLPNRIMIFNHSVQQFLPIDKKNSRFQSQYGRLNLRDAISQINVSRGNRPLIVLVSDFQRSTCAVIDSLFAEGTINFPTACVDVSPEAPWDYSVKDALYLKENYAEVKASVVAQGKKLEKGRLNLISEKRNAGENWVDVPENDSADIRININSDISYGSVVLKNSDPLEFDNVDYFSSEGKRNRRVVIVGDTDKNHVTAAAYASAGSGKWNPVLVKLPRDVKYDDLDSADLVVINGISAPSRAIEGFLTGDSRHKAIFFALGTDDREVEWYKKIFADVFGKCEVKINKSKDGLIPILSDTISDVWRGFPKIRCEGILISGYGVPIPGDVLVRLSDGTPVVSRIIDKHDNSWIISAFPIGITDDNNLCANGFYVAFIDRLSNQAVSRVKTCSAIWTAGVSMRNPFYGTVNVVSVFSSEGKLIKKLSQQPDIEFESPGIYKLVTSGTGASNYVAVKAPGEEMNLTYSKPNISSHKKKMVVLLSGEDFLNTLKKKSGFLLWNGPWILLLLLLICEMMVSRRKYKS